jgi:hypothetical protein
MTKGNQSFKIPRQTKKKSKRAEQKIEQTRTRAAPHHLDENRTTPVCK